MLAGLLLAATLLGAVAHADDTVKLAIGQIDTWNSQPPVLGERAGIFKKHGIVVENFATQGGGESLQAVISGAADIGIGTGTLGVLRAFANGAPLRIIGAGFTGVGDFYWYVRADSSIRSLQDATNGNTIAYSTNGSSSHSVVRGFAQELGVKAIPTATGGQPATLTQVMSRQIDIGWAAPPFGLKEVEEGRIRVVASGNDVPSLRNQTVRVEIINANVWNRRRDVMLRFVCAYRAVLEWMFSDPPAVKYYAEQYGWPEKLVELTRDKFQTKQAKQFDRISDMDAMMAEAVKLKFLDKPLSREQLAELIQIPPPDK